MTCVTKNDTEIFKKFDSFTHCEMKNGIIFQENLFLKTQTAIKVALQIEKSSKIDKSSRNT